MAHGAAAGTSTCRARALDVEGGEPIGRPSDDDSKAGGDKTGLGKAFSHSDDPSVNLTPVSRPTSSKLRQSHFCKPIHIGVLCGNLSARGGKCPAYCFGRTYRNHSESMMAGHEAGGGARRSLATLACNCASVKGFVR